MKVYVASSWRNQHQPSVVVALREDGHDVYDFRNPAPSEHGFHWSEIGTHWQRWSAEEYVSALEHQIAEHRFNLDFDAMKWCEVCVMVTPCGASANTEIAWCKGAGKKTIILLLDRELRALVVTGKPCFPNGEPNGLPREHLPKYLADIWKNNGRPNHQHATNPYVDVREEDVLIRMERGWEPELMWKMHDLVTSNLEVVRNRLNVWARQT